MLTAERATDECGDDAQNGNHSDMQRCREDSDLRQGECDPSVQQCADQGILEPAFDRITGTPGNRQRARDQRAGEYERQNDECQGNGSDSCHQELRTENQEPGTKNREPRTEN